MSRRSVATEYRRMNGRGGAGQGVIAEPVGQRLDLPRLGAADISVILGASLLPLATGIYLIQTVGWLAGLLASWIALPIAAGVGAFLAFVWTIPIRKTDILSIRRGSRVFDLSADVLQAQHGLARTGGARDECTGSTREAAAKK